MDLNAVCFWLFCVFFTGYLVLEGFDYGVGMLLPFLGRADRERQAMISTLAPVWEGNEVWLIAAGTVLFAGFPHVYATLFSGLYLALLLILTSLILRGAAFAMRNRADDRRWRRFWDWALFGGGVIPAFLWGMAISGLLAGLPIDGEKQYTGTLGNLFSLYTLSGGLVFVLVFLLHGTVYLALKMDEHFILQLRKTGLITGKYALFTVAGFVVLTFIYTDLAGKPFASAVLAVAAVALALCYRYLRQGRYRRSFACSTLAIITMTAAIFSGLFPRFIISSLNPEWNLSIYNAASNFLTLKIMTTTMAVVLPVVFILEGWKYYIFRQPVTAAATGFERRRKLWRHLLIRVKQLNNCAHNLSDILEKAKNTINTNQPQQTNYPLPVKAVQHIREIKALLHRSHPLIGLLTKLVKLLSKAP